MEKKLQRPTGIENSYFVRIKGSDTYIHYRDKKYSLKILSEVPVCLKIVLLKNSSKQMMSMSWKKSL
jgi:hypothetical protein